MPTALLWYDDVGAPLSGDTPVDGIAGTPGTGVTLELVNNKNGSGADPLTNAHLKALFDDGSGLAESGTEWADRHYLETRVLSGGHNTGFPTGDWQALGASATLGLPDLANDEGVKLQFRISAPSDATTDVEAVSLRIVDSPGQAMSQGVVESSAAGIYNGIYDGAFTYLLTGADVVEDSPQSMDVDIADTVWIAGGYPYTAVAQEVTITNAASSMERYDLLSLDAAGSGTITTTSGTEVAGPLVEGNKPDLPTGDIPLCYIYVKDSTAQTVVVDADIENVWSGYLAYYPATTSGLQVTLGRGPIAVVDNSLLNTQSDLLVSVTDDETNHVWLKRDGTLAVSIDGSNPADRALLMYEVVAASGSISSISDRRIFRGGHIEILEFHFAGEITGSDEVYKHLHNTREAFILPINGFAMSAGTNAAGASSGATILDLESSEGGAWTSLFGTGSTKPQIAYDASDPRDFFNALPTIWAIPPNARLRAQVDTLPSGSTTEALDVTLTMLVVL